MHNKCAFYSVGLFWTNQQFFGQLFSFLMRERWHYALFFYYLLNSKCKTTKISLSCGVWCTWLCLNVRWVCVCIVSTSLWLGNVQMSPGLAHPAPCNSCCKPCTVIVKCVSPILGKVVPEKPLYTKQNQFWYPVPI